MADSGQEKEREEGKRDARVADEKVEHDELLELLPEAVDHLGRPHERRARRHAVDLHAPHRLRLLCRPVRPLSRAARTLSVLALALELVLERLLVLVPLGAGAAAQAQECRRTTPSAVMSPARLRRAALLLRGGGDGSAGEGVPSEEG